MSAAAIPASVAGPESSAWRTRLGVGVAWNLVSSVSLQGVTLAVNLALANILGQAQFGKYMVIVTSILSTSVAAQLAAGYTCTRYLAQYRSTDKAKAGRILGLSGVVATGSALLAASTAALTSSSLASRAFHSADLGQPLALGSIFLFFSVVNGFQVGALQGLEAFRPLGEASLRAAILTLVIAPLGGFFGGLSGAVLALAATGLARTVLFHHALRLELSSQQIHLDLRGFRREMDTLTRFALPAAISGLGIGPSLWLVNAFLARQPGGFPQVAIYSATYSMLTLVLFIPQVVDRVGMSLMNFELGTTNLSHYRKMFVLNLALALALVSLGSALVAIIAPYLLGLFGKGFSDAGYPVLFVLLCASLPEALTVAVGQLLVSRERLWLLTLGVNLPRDAGTVALAYLLIPGHGALGLAYAYLGSRLLAFFLTCAHAAGLGFMVEPIRIRG